MGIEICEENRLNLCERMHFAVETLPRRVTALDEDFAVFLLGKVTFPTEAALTVVALLGEEVVCEDMVACAAVCGIVEVTF